jgi:xylitol oxidase
MRARSAPGYGAPVTPINWAGNLTYRAHAIHAPSTLEQLQELICAVPRVRILGSRHSFTDIADSAEMVTLERMAPDVVVDPDALTVLSTSSRGDTRCRP